MLRLILLTVDGGLDTSLRYLAFKLISKFHGGL